MSRLFLVLLILLPLAQGCRTNPPKTCGKCPIPTKENFQLEPDQFMMDAVRSVTNRQERAFSPVKLFTGINSKTGCSSLYIQCFQQYPGDNNGPLPPPPNSTQLDILVIPNEPIVPSRVRRAYDPDDPVPEGRKSSTLFSYFIYTKDHRNVSVHSYLDNQRNHFDYQEITCEESGEWTFKYPPDVNGGAKLSVAGAFCFHALSDRVGGVFGYTVPGDKLPTPFLDIR